MRQKIMKRFQKWLIFIKKQKIGKAKYQSRTNPGLFFLYFRLFNTVDNKLFRSLESNCRSLVSEATALPTMPHPLP